MSIELYTTYVFACIAVVIVPGPVVSVIIANSLRNGAAGGLATIAGSQAGLGIFLVLMAAGLAPLMNLAGKWFEALRIVGAFYLLWLGVRLWLDRGSDVPAAPSGSKSGFFVQGLFVMITNPKVLVFLGAFLPQFINPAQDVNRQFVILGLTFMVVAAILDSGYAILSGRAGVWLTRRRVRLLEKLSGSCLIGGGIWLLSVRR